MHTAPARHTHVAVLVAFSLSQPQATLHVSAKSHLLSLRGTNHSEPPLPSVLQSIARPLKGLPEALDKMQGLESGIMESGSWEQVLESTL